MTATTVTDLRHREVGFTSLYENLHTTTPGGRLVFHVFAALAEFIRELSVGVYMCTDLDCPLYVRRIKTFKAIGGRLQESLTLDEQIARTLDKLAAFVDKVLH